MSENEPIQKILEIINKDINEIIEQVLSGNMDNMERYRYFVGKLHGLNSTKNHLLNPPARPDEI